MKNPIYLALDTPDPILARRLIDECRDFIGGLKIGITFWFTNGPAITHRVVEGFDWFLDAKLHDIPFQAAGAIRGLVWLQPKYVSMHADVAMMQAVVEAANDEAAKLAMPVPKLLGVTTLTHQPATLTEIVAKGHQIMTAGLDGVIASPLELPSLRDELGSRPILLTPGIRDPLAPVIGDDQQRTATAREAYDKGANIIVVGRPITLAPVPRDAARLLYGSLSA